MNVFLKFDIKIVFRQKWLNSVNLMLRQSDYINKDLMMFKTS